MPKSGVEYLAQHPGWKTKNNRKLNPIVVDILDSSDVATILAALRCFQERYENCSVDVIREDWPNHFEGIEPLGTENISTLCERINLTDVLKIK
jgi:hypothetical protein